ncbi:MAG: TIGR03905 family TSCPD domain-containing protein [Firmicutes bacterium]|nr:TIGR03905 family TSCPD domain-containing protein [Bacillota bacterium]
MKYTYQPAGVCSHEISFDLENGKVYNIKFTGGCSGNLKMIAKLLDGVAAEEIVRVCSNNICGMRNTSCADQLSLAVKEALEKEKIAC